MALFLARLRRFLPTELPVIAWSEAPRTELPNDALPLVTLINPVVPVESPQAERDAPRSYFTVTRGMPDALNVLGLARDVGMRISFVELNLAYRERVISTHPDKTLTDSQDDFIAVQRALALIMDEVKSLSSQDKTWDDILSEFTAYFTNMGDEWSNQMIFFRGMIQKNKKLQEDLDNASEKLDKLAEREVLAGQKISALHQDAGIVCQETKVLSQRIDMVCQRTDRLHEEAVMMRQEAEILSDELLRLCEEAEEELRVRQAKLAENDILSEIDEDHPDSTVIPIHEAPSRRRSASPGFFDELKTSNVHNTLLTEDPNHGHQANR